VLTVVRAFSSWRSAPTLPLALDGRPETDLIQVRGIEGLEPVKATINTAPFGSVDGSDFTGGNVPSRNIVLTLHPNPNWDTWRYENLRKLLYSYFMPKKPVLLVFESDDISPVEITGYVESVGVNIFSKEPELQVSVICPYPYFSTVDPIVVTGTAIAPGGVSETITYNGTIEAGIAVKVSFTSGSSPTYIQIQIGDTAVSTFIVDATVDAGRYFQLSSVPMQKFVQNVSIADGVITNKLSSVREGSEWPILQPGDNDFSVITNGGVLDWELSYFELFGGL
jgi:Phage tail protein RIFT-related domain